MAHEVQRAPRPTGSLAGQLLIAMPGLSDGRFARSVICICAHSPEGAMGLVLNRPIPKLSFEALLRQLDIEPTPPQRRIRLVNGGPVEEGRGFVLHSGDWHGEGSLPVAGGFTLTANVDILKAIAEGGGPRQCLLALGYAAWGPGQLDAEMAANAWLTATPDEALVFDPDTDTTWARAMSSLGVDPGRLAEAAGHA